MSGARGRSGFTLIEVMIALMLGAMLASLIARLAGVATGVDRAAAVDRVAWSRAINARRELTSVFSSLDVGRDAAGAFDGQPDRVTFTAWLAAPGDWYERRPVTLGVNDHRLELQLGPQRMPLAQRVDAFDIDYLLDPGANTRWVRRWSSPTSAPLAVRLRIVRRDTTDAIVADTLLLLIGSRG